MQPISPLTAAAHELKTPLTLISGLSSTLLGDELALTPKQREYLERILLSSDRSLRMVQGLVDAYRVRQTAFELPLEPVNVHQITDEVAHELTPYSKKMNQDIIVRLKRSTNMVVANRILLHEALSNLVENALRHGQGDHVIIGGRNQQANTRLSVANQGAKISEAEFRHLQERIGGSAQPLTALANSSGIGLYIVRELIAAMGGKLGCERSATGTSLYFDLFASTQLSLL